MPLKPTIVFIFGFFIWSGLFSQDTLTVMQYNLLYYGHTTGFCNNNNNSLGMKDPSLRLILDEIQPDIFTVNEIANNETIHQHLLDDNLNREGVNHFKKADFSPVATSNIGNMLYYDSRKLTLKNQYVAQATLRDVDVYELYYNANDLEQGDTAFIVCVVAHLKAGRTDSDRDMRELMVSNTMQFLEPKYAHENVMFMGDFNFYTGYEPGFQLMLNYPNPEMRFLDPIGQIGDWHENAFYAGIHTQSTHTSPTSGCPAGGGMDDRFDFIMISDEIRFGTRHVRYVQDSYHAFGQDGLRFNGAINDPPANTAVSPEIADALHNFSDHLPVVLKLRIDKVLNTTESHYKPFMVRLSPQPAADRLGIGFHQPSTGLMAFTLFDGIGRVRIYESQYLHAGKQHHEIDVSRLPAGMYFLQLQNAKGLHERAKVIISK